jgi:hypothetical protein
MKKTIWPIRPLYCAFLFAILIPIASLYPGPGSRQKQEIEGDLDVFMSKVLERREINWEQLHGYVFNELETLEIRGVKLPPMANFRKEYVWIVRDGYLVRSPVRVNGVKVSKEEQAASEEDWIREHKDKRHDSLDREIFLGFKFHPGTYLYAGKQNLDGRELVAIEHYPSKKAEDSKKEEFERMFEKTILVTMLIEPKEHQLVRITFDNVGMEFLPVRWLVRLEELRASMTMDKPFGEVWLPKRIVAAGSVDTAGPSLSVKYSREFYDYNKTDVRVKLFYDPPSMKEPKR